MKTLTQRTQIAPRPFSVHKPTKRPFHAPSESNRRRHPTPNHRDPVGEEAGSSHQAQPLPPSTKGRLKTINPANKNGLTSCWIIHSNGLDLGHLDRGARRAPFKHTCGRRSPPRAGAPAAPKGPLARQGESRTSTAVSTAVRSCLRRPRMALTASDATGANFQSASRRPDHSGRKVL